MWYKKRKYFSELQLIFVSFLSFHSQKETEKDVRDFLEMTFNMHDQKVEEDSNESPSSKSTSPSHVAATNGSSTSPSSSSTLPSSSTSVVRASSTLLAPLHAYLHVIVHFVCSLFIILLQTVLV